MQYNHFLPKLLAGVVVLFCCINMSARAQRLRKASSWVLHHSLIDTTTPGQPSFRIYPTVAYSPETNLELGFSSLYLFQAKKDSTNRISELNAFTFVTLQSQYGLWLDNAIYGDKDKWFILGRARYQRFFSTHQTPTTLLRLSSSTVSRHMPFCWAIFSR